MTVLRDWRRLTLRLLAPVAVAAAALTACGGGTEQAVAYKPSRLVVFGDDSSVLVDDGAHNARKYSVNGLSSDNVRGCGLLPTFPQTVAARYGFVFAECNTSGAAVTAFSRAKAGAKVSDAVKGLAQQIAEGALGADDLVTVYIGTHDIIELYELVASGGKTRADAIAEAEQRGNAAAEQVNAILATGAKALVFLVPELGVSPYAGTKNLNDPGASALIQELVYVFNGYLRTRIDARKYDARNFGLIITDDIVAAIAKSPSSFTAYLASPYNATDAVCLVALPNCTSATADLVSGASSSSHLWASDRLLGYPGHNRLAAEALSRLNNLPF